MIVKRFKDGSFLEYDKGSFDEWCVYYTNSDGVRKPPKDTDYFAQLRDLAKRFTKDKVYNDYILVYNWTEKKINPKVLDDITALSASYNVSAAEADVIFTVLYMAMIAEENKENTKLGKRIKRLGVYKLLKEGASVNDAANFIRGMKWHEIDKMCRKYGF